MELDLCGEFYIMDAVDKILRFLGIDPDAVLTGQAPRIIAYESPFDKIQDWIQVHVVDEFGSHIVDPIETFLTNLNIPTFSEIMDGLDNAVVTPIEDYLVGLGLPTVDDVLNGFSDVSDNFAAMTQLEYWTDTVVGPITDWIQLNVVDELESHVVDPLKEWLQTWIQEMLEELVNSGLDIDYEVHD